MKHLDEGKALHESQAGFRVGRGCVDNIFTLNELVHGRLMEGKETRYMIVCGITACGLSCRNLV